jgi:hypothetical protein
LQWDLPITEGFDRSWNHVIGHPIYQAAHIGLSLKPRRAIGSKSFPRLQARGSPDVCALLGGCAPATVLASLAQSVGIIFSRVMSPSPLVLLAPLRFQFPQTVSVGSKAPPSIPLMGRTDIRRAKDSVAPGVSTRQKFPNNHIPSPGSDAWAVFQEDEARSNSINCSEDFADKSASCSRNSRAFTCC